MALRAQWTQCPTCGPERAKGPRAMRPPSYLLAALALAACSQAAPDAATGDTPDALIDSSGGPVVTDGADTEVWSVTNAWTDTSSPDARAAGLAWTADSGLTWEDKFGLWVGSFPRAAKADGWGQTIAILTPYGKELPGPALECAEVALALRALFASFYHLPFYMTGWDDKAKRPMYAGHFGFVDASG